MNAPLSNVSQTMSPTVLPVVARAATVLGSEGQRLLDSVSLTVGQSGTLVVLGPNGAGKSLMLRVLTGLVPVQDGSVTWAGQDVLGDKIRRISFVFQKPVLFRRTVRANIAFAVRRNCASKSEADDRARAILEDADLMHLADAPARRLSGGEQQRVAIARARVTNPEIMFLDEPTAHLDPASTAIIEQMILKARQSGTRIVHVTHDLGQARRLADDVVFIHRGAVVEHEPAKAFFTAQKSKAAQAFVAGDLVL